VAAERAFNARLGGACQVPVAGHAVLRGPQVVLTGLVAAPDGSQVLRDEIQGPQADAAALGEALAERLLARGADAILRAVGVLP